MAQAVEPRGVGVARGHVGRARPPPADLVVGVGRRRPGSEVGEQLELQLRQVLLRVPGRDRVLIGAPAGRLLALGAAGAPSASDVLAAARSWVSAASVLTPGALACLVLASQAK